MSSHDSNSAVRLFATQDLPKVAFGQGSYITDVDGKRYIDGSSGPATYCIGHGNGEVNDAIKAQLDQIAHGYRYMFTSDSLEDLQAIIARNAGGGLTHSVLVSGGSEAVESCLKIALQYQTAIGQKSRRRFIARNRSWHGNTLGALSISGFAQRRAPYVGALIEASFMSAANIYRPPADIPVEQIGDYCANELDKEICKLGAETVCAFVFEPVVGAAGGAVPAPPGYSKKMREVCDKHGVLMIADEVMCGVGRTGDWRSLSFDDVVPDVMSIAKGLGGGYMPLGASVCQQHIADTLFEKDGVILTGHTFAGHTAACAAGVAVQKIIEREGLVEKVKRDGEWMLGELHSMLGQHPYIGDIRGRGFFIGVEFVKDRESKEPFDPELSVFTKIGREGFANGLITYPVGGNVDGNRGDITIIAPPYNATRAELTEILDKFDITVKAVFSEVNKS